MAPLTPRKVRNVFTERLGRNIHHEIIQEAKKYGSLFRLEDPHLTYSYHIGVFEEEGSPRQGVFGQDWTHFKTWIIRKPFDLPSVLQLRPNKKELRP